MIKDSNFNFDLYYPCPDEIEHELKNIPQPYFLSSVFPETDIAICRPLPYPYDLYAITHYGICFYFKDMKLRYFKELQRYYVDSTSIIYETVMQNRSFLAIPDRFGMPRMFDVDKLILERFYNIPIDSTYKIIHLDGSIYNHHYLNLEVQ